MSDINNFLKKPSKKPNYESSKKTTHFFNNYVEFQTLENVELKDAYLDGCRFEEVEFINSKFTDIESFNCFWEGNFLRCHFTDVSIYNESFMSCEFSDCTFTRCIFYGAKFYDCEFINTRINDSIFALNNLGAKCSFQNTNINSAFDKGVKFINEAHIDHHGPYR